MKQWELSGVTVDLRERSRIMGPLPRPAVEARLDLVADRFQTLLERVPGIVYVALADEERTPVYVSPWVEAILGVPPMAWLADPRSWLDRVHPVDRDRVLLDLDLCRQLRQPFSVEYRLIANDGRVRWVHDEAVLLRDEAGQPSRWQGVIVPLSEGPDEGRSPWAP